MILHKVHVVPSMLYDMVIIHTAPDTEDGVLGTLARVHCSSRKRIPRDVLARRGHSEGDIRVKSRRKWL